jgi:phosphoglycolate phosphatase
VTDSRPPGTVLFDLDGTFADTLPDLRYALALAMEERQLTPPPAASLRSWVSAGARAMAEKACGPGVDAAALEALVTRFLSLYAANLCRHTQLFDGMQALLDALAARKLRWGIVTNKLGAYSEPLMQALDPAGHAACVVSGDSTANAKPHPQPLLHACRLLGRPPADCVYVGDARNDVIAARRAGMRSVVALYGYIPAGEDPLSWQADAAIDTPRELLAWLDSY